jgi:hypothetical protein
MLNRLLDKFGKRNVIVYVSIFIVGVAIGYYACSAISSVGDCSFLCPKPPPAAAPPPALAPAVFAQAPLPPLPVQPGSAGLVASSPQLPQLPQLPTQEAQQPIAAIGVPLPQTGEASAPPEVPGGAEDDATIITTI